MKLDIVGLTATWPRMSVTQLVKL